MCGIVAFFSESKLKMHQTKIDVLIDAANRRGGHSFGYVLYDQDGSPIAEVKRMGRGERLSADVFRAYGILYHARYGTSAPLLPHYSQPIRLGMGYGAHNGHVSGPENPKIGHAMRELDSAHLLQAVEDYDEALVSGLSGYGATVTIPDRGSWAEVWAHDQQIYMSATKRFWAVSSVDVKIGVKWQMHRGDGTTAIVTTADAVYSGVDYTVGSMRLSEDSWGTWGRYRSLTNRGEKNKVVDEKEIDFGDDWLRDYPGLLGGKL